MGISSDLILDPFHSNARNIIPILPSTSSFEKKKIYDRINPVLDLWRFLYKPKESIEWGIQSSFEFN